MKREGSFCHVIGQAQQEVTALNIEGQASLSHHRTGEREEPDYVTWYLVGSLST